MLPTSSFSPWPSSRPCCCRCSTLSVARKKPVAVSRRPRGGSLSSATSTSSAGCRTARCAPSPCSTGPSCSSASAVVVSSACAAQDHVFATRPSSLTIPRTLLYGCTDIAFAPHGAYWRGARKMAVHVLLSLQKEESAGPTEWRLSRDNVKALLEDLFGAGTEATIIVLEWAMAELLRDKGAMQRLQHEVRRAGTGAADNESSLQITEQDLPGMEYLRAVIKETMRLHTPGPLLLPREAMRATRIQGHHDVPAGAMVIVNAWAIARDPEAWEAPEEFRPERFVGSAVDFRGHHFQLIPFGAGRRMCPGLNLSMSVVELALANLVGRFEWALPEAEPELDMEEAPGCTSRRSAPLRAIATRSCLAEANSM
ncbi:hypothetical protein HU200_010413 [Digitaria exilis]|uniref:Cytochrome P450 n=1 Tax=Digitaria exilis TaxID=1010633 RepID=A0A835FKA8_9POAL|nr:hypothetical protein HU200_010413 [Digitaria exilis]